MNDSLEARLIDAARRAAPAFGLDPTEVRILNRSENVVCALRASDGSQVALRLHRPGYNTPAELRSEVRWVRALASANVRVPRAMPTTNGDYYTPIVVETDAGPVEHQVGVISWVEGQPLGDPLEAGDLDLSHHFERIGELAAAVRVQSSSWTLPDNFVRRRWDADAFVGDTPLWGRFWEVPTLNAEQQDVLTQARQVMHETLSAQPTTPDRFGLIHADLHLGNVMANGDELTLIDFDDAGFGWYAYELAVSLNNVLDEPWYPAARTAMLQGYRRIHPLADDEVDLIDTLLIMRSLMILGWLAARPELPAFDFLGEVTNGAIAAATDFLNR